jgi:iron complex outermembrane receptor protein
MALLIGALCAGGSACAQGPSADAGAVAVAEFAAPAAAGPAPAAAPAAPLLSGQAGEVVVVTGARGEARSIARSLSPIDVVGAKELAATGKQNLRDALATLYPSYSNTPGFKGQTGIAVATATLRGLDANSVLVLVNGKRRHHTPLIINGQSPTDLDLIPMSAIDHVEVLRDGAAAQYGSDAISGVINIILKSNAAGGSASTLYGQYAHTVGDFEGRGKTNNLLFNQGIELGHDGGFISFSATADAHRATNDQGPIPLTTKLYFGNDPRETSLSRYKMRLGKPAGETYNLGYNAELPLTPNTTLYSYATAGKRRSQGWGYYRPANSPQNYVDVYPDGFIPKFQTRENDYQAVFGVRGKDVLGWDWDLSTSYGRDRADIYTLESLNGSLGPAYQNQHDFYDGALESSEWVTNLDLNRRVQTGWFTAPLSVSAGYEHRFDHFEQKAGEWASYANGGYVFPSGPLAGQRPNSGASGMAGFAPEVTGSYARTNDALYADFSQTLATGWSAAAAARYERYDDFGYVRSGKLSTRYELSDSVALRATLSNGFSAPTLQQQYYTTKVGGYTTDPLTGQLRQSFALSAPAGSVVARALGAQPLQPQRSVNHSIGIVYKPSRTTNISLDAYQIAIRNRIISTPTLQGTTVNNILNAAGLAAEAITSVTYFTNAASTRTRGVDLVVDHRSTLPQGWGKIDWIFTSNQNATTIRSLAGVPPVLANSGIAYNRATTSALTENNPKNISSLTALWKINRVELTLKETRYSKVKNASAIAAARDEVVDAAYITNLNLGYALSPRARLSVGADNLFDKRPNELNAEAKKFFAIPVTTPSYSWYSPYGIDGAYYYARLDVSW